MKIISKFKDYYDYMAQIYGVDELIVYNRIPFDKDLLPSSGFKIPQLHSGWYNSLSSYDKTFRWLCIMGEYYLQIADKTSYPYTWKIITLNNPLRYEYKTDLIKLHKKLNSPVFAINVVHYKSFHIEPNIPILADNGIASIISAEQMYQQLSAFINSVLRDNIDTKPPVQIDDKYKLTQAGFDAKISFRHRK